jgi:hypothetical protein
MILILVTCDRQIREITGRSTTYDFRIIPNAASLMFFHKISFMTTGFPSTCNLSLRHESTLGCLLMFPFHWTGRVLYVAIIGTTNHPSVVDAEKTNQ